MLQVVRFVATPTIWQAVLLALLVSLGLLTKATFLAFLPALFVLVAFVLLRRGYSARKAFAAALALSLLAGGLGSWRFVQNYREVRNPFVSNLDSGHTWVIAQQSSYRGAISFFDVNLLKLLVSPSVSPKTEGAYPLLLYGTFWYQHIPESNFLVSSSAPFYYLGSVIYVFALVPSLVFVFGLFLLARRLPRFVTTLRLVAARRPTFAGWLCQRLVSIWEFGADYRSCLEISRVEFDAGASALPVLLRFAGTVRCRGQRARRQRPHTHGHESGNAGVSRVFLSLLR